MISMTVTAITEINKSRVRIVTDDEFSFVLYKGELRIFQIKEGEELSEEDFLEITERLLPKRAKLRAMNLLKSRSYTEKQLFDKLKTGGYPEEIVKKAVAYVAGYGYINDESYAKDFIEYHKDSKSKTRIMKDLSQKGISKEIIEKAFEEVVGEDRQKLEEEQIVAWIRKKKFNASEATYQEKQKFFAFLYRKGFQIDAIRRALLLDITSI